MTLTMMRRLSFNECEPPMLKRQARSSRSTLRQLFEPLYKPMQPQNRKEEKKEDQHILAFCYLFQPIQILVRAKRCVNQGCIGSHSARGCTRPSGWVRIETWNNMAFWQLCGGAPGLRVGGGLKKQLDRDNQGA